jgi:hypothetical protein
MNKFSEIIGRIISIIIIIAGAGLTIWVMANTDALSMDNFKMKPETIDKYLNPYIAVTAIALIFAALSVIIFQLINIISNPKAGLKMLASLIGLGIIYFISYSLADNSIDAEHFVDNNITELGSKLIGSLIYLVYIIGGIAVFVTAGSSVFKLFNK